MNQPNPPKKVPDLPRLDLRDSWRIEAEQKKITDRIADVKSMGRNPAVEGY